MPSRPYTVQFSGSSAELWTARRLSFDNKADQPAKNAILGALDLIVPDKDQLLSATLTCPRDGFFDVENVLLYNLGRVSTLGRLAHTGLRFEYRSPAGLSPHPAFPFHHTYTLVPLATSSPGNPVASFRCTLRRLRSDQKPGTPSGLVWLKFCPMNPLSTSH